MREAASIKELSLLRIERLLSSSGWDLLSQNDEMRAAIDRRVRDSARRFRVIPVLPPGAERAERSSLPTFLAATTWVEFRDSLDDADAFYRLVCGIRGLEPGPEPGQAFFEGQCPRPVSI